MTYVHYFNTRLLSKSTISIWWYSEYSTNPKLISLPTCPRPKIKLIFIFLSSNNNVEISVFEYKNNNFSWTNKKIWMIVGIVSELAFRRFPQIRGYFIHNYVLNLPQPMYCAIALAGIKGWTICFSEGPFLEMRSRCVRDEPRVVWG